MSMDADRLSGVKYQSHAEPNIYFQNWLTSDHSSQNTSAAAQLDSENEISEVNSGIQRRNTVKVTNEKQVMKIKVLVIVAVSVMSVFLALAIGLALFATIHTQKQLSLPDIAMEVTKHVTPLQGNLMVLKNQLIDVYTKQVNEHAQKIQQLNEINDQQTQTLNDYAQQIQQLNEINGQQTQTLNEYAQQIQTSNDVTETISNNLAEYAQQTGIMEDNVNQYRAMVDQLRNNMSTVPTIKTAYIGLYGQPLKVSLQEQDPSTLAVLGYRSILTIPDTGRAYTSSDNTIAYRPNFNDLHNSSLAVLFFNLDAAFPCLRNANTPPVCSLFSQEEDGFLGGRSLIQAADTGNHFRIFSRSNFVATFGFGIAGCSTFGRSCVPTYVGSSYGLSLVCLLPRSVCT